MKHHKQFKIADEVFPREKHEMKLGHEIVPAEHHKTLFIRTQHPSKIVHSVKPYFKAGHEVPGLISKKAAYKK